MVLTIMILTATLLMMISVAMMTLTERKILGLSMIRMGPNKVSMVGILQPVTDAMKLMNKQSNRLSSFSMNYYYLCSLSMFWCAFFAWMAIEENPITETKFTLITIMLLLGMSSLSVMLASWTSSSKYSMLGSVRTVAQLVSYEPPLYMIMIVIIIMYSTTSMFMMSFYKSEMNAIKMPMMILIWIPCLLAELNRTPFDFSESESELVSGFNTEFGSKSFTMMFLAEYSMILMLSNLTTMLFLSKSSSKEWLILTLMMMISIRATLPRMRYDKLMMACWKVMIPMSTILMMIYFQEMSM